MAIDPFKKLATPDRTARYKIVIDGVPFLPDHKTTVQEVTVQMEIDTPTMWTVRLAVANTGVMLPDVDLFSFLGRYRPGALASILFTTETVPLPLVTGPLTAIEPENDGDTPAVELRGFDLMYRLRHGIHNVSYPGMTDSGVATQVGLLAQVPIIAEPTTYVYDTVQQYRQSYFEFLRKRADRIGFELISEAVGVLFRTPPKVGPPVVTLKNGRELMKFDPKMQMLTEGETVQVYSYDLRLGAPIVTAAIPVKSAMGTLDAQATTGVAAGMPPSPRVVVDQPVNDQAEAQILAQAAQDKAKRGFVTGRGRAVGDPKIRPGQFIFIQNIGMMFGGLYYVTAATHTINEEGYYTDFEVRRDAI